MVRIENLQYEEVRGFRFGYTPIGQPWLFTYLYHVDGLLIDTGQRKARKSILDATDSLDIEQIFITHHHEDHSGNIRPIQQRHNCPVYGSAGCSQLMKNPPALSLAQKLTWGSRPAFNNIVVADGELRTPNHVFQIIPIPGHAADMVALYEPEKKWLFSADLFINRYIGYFLSDESIADQISSIRNILDLDFKVLFCSHNPQLSAPKDKLMQKLRYLERVFEQVAAMHDKGYKSEQIFKTLGLKENRLVKYLSAGQLSKMNMVKSIVRDLEGKYV